MNTACMFAQQGDALYAMELALSLEKLNFVKLRELHDVAVRANDAQVRSEPQLGNHHVHD